MVIRGITHMPDLGGVVTNGQPTVFSLQKPTIEEVSCFPAVSELGLGLILTPGCHSAGSDGFDPAKLADALDHSTSYSGIIIARINVMMHHLSRESNRRVNTSRQKPGNGTSTQSPTPIENPVEEEITDLIRAESRIEALRSLVLIFLREVDSLKKVVGTRERKNGENINLDKKLDAYEASLISDALIKTKGNQRDAAKLLNIKPTTLNAKMKRLGITVETAVSA